MSCDALVRSLSTFADRANVGLSVLREEREYNDEVRSSIIDGLRFCKAAMAAVPNVDAMNGRDPEEIKSMILSDGVVQRSWGDGEAKDLRGLCDFFESISKGATVPDDETLSRVQDKLYELGAFFYERDITALRQFKQKRSLKAYG